MHWQRKILPIIFHNCIIRILINKIFESLLVGKGQNNLPLNNRRTFFLISFLYTVEIL
ncbi:hypothetical protein CLOAM1060 [Candidatus Cloacimonas acidaminovorans str. Evry]|uniref:Uncharacterized protein n=1 Tax=Cloacimonas acidaminovorans (strain Evry) TaxID=459349 RepID=B0VHW1_CLOAI|nr:hypothetical protein CLOAM1060 [Candidatus Cloacimonas acidaminovorans str. Evry]